MRIRKEVLPFAAIALAIGGAAAAAFALADQLIGLLASVVATLIIELYLLYFFRDPPRITPADDGLIFAPADGVIARIQTVDENKHLNCRAVRISTFLSLMDVHVNRVPFAGTVRSASYHPGKRYFTFQDKSSEYNQHSAIVVENGDCRYLMHQIVGPVARRVVYWLDIGQDVSAGDDFGMMKFGSRLDLYFPEGRLELLVGTGDRVVAGETPIGRITAL